MGLLINGVWSTAWYDTEKSDGKFVREDAGFRHWVTADGSAGCSGKGGFRLSLGVTIFIYLMPVPGRIAQ